MKTKIIAAMALLSTSFTPISLMTPAQATPAPASDANAPDEQAICNALYVDNQTTPADWRATVTGASSTATDPTAVPGTEQQINYRPDTSSTFTYTGFTNTTNPLYRIGGSPNMWGQMVFNDKVWDNTLYDVQMDFNHTVSYSWTCHVEQYVDHPEFVPDPPPPPPPPPGNGGTCENNGNGGNNGNNNGNNGQNGGNGNGNNGCGNGNGGPDGGTNSNSNSNGNGDNGCGAGGEGTNDDVFAGNSDHVCHDGQPGTIVHHYSWDAVADYPQTAGPNTVDDGYDVTATGLQLAGHVTGVVYDVFGTYKPNGYVLLSCISPGKKGGTWTPKAYYTGGQCNTTVFNAAPTIVPSHQFDTPPTNSLPAL